jgi:hypothetical protein
VHFPESFLWTGGIAAEYKNDISNGDNVTDIIAATHEYIGSRRIPTDTQIRAWLRSLPRDTVAQIEAIVDAAIEASTDGAAALAATESACLKLAPIVMGRR